MRTALLFMVLAVALLAPVQHSGAQQPPTTWVAWLSGADQVPRNASTATGFASFQVNAARTAIDYWLFVNGIQNVQMAHIHTGAAGQNGPVAIWLYPAAPPAVLIPGAVSGYIGQGTITERNFGGPLQGRRMADVLGMMSSGTLYVNVHTTAFPGGEIRGQVQ